jgi:cytoskeletal protein CcmA (bactofilin family)
MFKKLITQAADTGSGEAIDTILGAGTHFKGVLSFDGSVRIDGKFDGEIAAGGMLVVGEGSIVKANVRVGRAVIAGQLQGDVEATESLEVQPTGRIFGDIQTPELQLARGVTLEGRVVINKRSDGSMSVNIGGAKNEVPARDGSAAPRVVQKV